MSMSAASENDDTLLALGPANQPVNGNSTAGLVNRAHNGAEIERGAVPAAFG
jgi:hypothetical protein